MDDQLDVHRIGLLDLPDVLLRACSEINSVLANLRRSRDMLEQSTVEKLQQTNSKLQEVTSATETAATDMLDGLDRALGMVDELDAESETNPQRAADVRGDLRNELFSLMNCLQFQDITTQQINYASSVLVDMEHRLAELAKLFDPRSFGIEDAALQLTPRLTAAFDPAATTTDADQRQALVDSIFARP
jgi:chemotaxis regulatin CheY-phosphate phosphatase CheZ